MDKYGRKQEVTVDGRKRQRHQRKGELSSGDDRNYPGGRVSANEGVDTKLSLSGPCTKKDVKAQVEQVVLDRLGQLEEKHGRLEGKYGELEERCKRISQQLRVIL
ncbi:hypothetical protein LTR08_008846 [Meristemomyces frigidus]|nr:hypothetical protein LTR08_008846 [Meristemomyces frigidus]